MAFMEMNETFGKGHRLIAAPAQHPRNNERAGRALDAINEYRGHQPEDEADLRDLLCDLMHYADANGIDFDEEIGTAFRAYQEELEQPDW